jgi:hypothetical protein
MVITIDKRHIGLGYEWAVSLFAATEATRAVPSIALATVDSLSVPCPSGRRSMSRKHVMVQAIRGFKSHRYRH